MWLATSPEKDQLVLDVVDSLELDSRMSNDRNCHGVYKEGLNLRVAAEGCVGIYLYSGKLISD